jgi:inorganic pyrophosphatase
MEVDLEALPIGEDASNVVVEVPVGSRNKYKYEPEMGTIMLDRVLLGNVRYPGDYGFVPSAVSTDGEPLDVIVASCDPVFPSCMIRARVLGPLEMTGEWGMELNISEVLDDDPCFEDFHTLNDVLEQNLREVENFFVVCKRLEGDEERKYRAGAGWRRLTRQSASAARLARTLEL